LYLAAKEGNSALVIDSLVQRCLAWEEQTVRRAGAIRNAAKLGRVNIHDLAGTGFTEFICAKAGLQAKECDVLSAEKAWVWG
jgi:hypothetical protein